MVTNFYPKAFEIDKILSKDHDKTTEKELFRIVNSGKEYEEHLFKNLKDIHWFDYLKEKDYFSPNKAPAPVKAEEKGYYKIPVWNVLQYLERISEQVNIYGNEKYIDELLGIIKNVTNYHIEHNKKLDNYHTWWYFVKILLNIPNYKIPKEIIKLIPIWLDSKFDNTLPGADIARELLPKFLNSNDSKDLEKAEKIIEYITSIKWTPLSKERADLIREKEKPKTILDTHWLLDTFKKNAARIGEKCGVGVVKDLSQKIKQIIKQDESKIYLRDITYLFILRENGENNYEVEIRDVKDKTERDINKEILLEKQSEGKLIKSIRIENCRNKQEFVEKTKKLISNASIFEEIDKKLLTREIQNLYRNLYNNGTYKSFYEESLHPIKDALETITYLLKNSLLAKARVKKDETRKILKEFWGDKYLFFRKMVVFIVGKEWSKYNDLFWQWFDEELLDTYSCKPELYNLFKNNVSTFSRTQKEKIKSTIEKGPKYYIAKENEKKDINRWKQRWYLALKSDTFFAGLYEEMKKITGTEAKEEKYQIETRWGPGESSLTKEEILKMPNKELAKYMIDFKGGDLFNPPTVEGLATTFKSTVQEKPEKFIENLNPFLNVGYYYIYYLLWGIRDAWGEKKNIDWDKPLKFVKGYIDKPGFWEDKFKMKGEDARDAKYSCITCMVGELIQEGTRDDAWAFSEEYFDVAKNIIFTILDKEKNQEEQERGAVIQALNSPFGKSITALIYLALRIARVEDKKKIKKETKWDPDFKKKYETLLKDEIIESYTLLGQYIANLHYLDKKWVAGKIKSIHKEKSYLWEAFMEGYLFGGKVYKNLYKLMQEHYQLAIKHSFKDEDTEERLVQHICAGYLRDTGSVGENALFSKLLGEGTLTQIKEIIGFFWMQRKNVIGDDEGVKIKNRIVEWWQWIYKKYKDEKAETLTKKDKEILSDLSQLTVFLSQIDSKNYNWLLLSAAYLDFHSSLFIFEYLNKLKEKGESVKYIGKIILKILENSTPGFRQEDIKSIVEFLYKSGHKKQKREADKICNIYGSRGFEFLRDLWEKYNRIG